VEFEFVFLTMFKNSVQSTGRLRKKLITMKPNIGEESFQDSSITRPLRGLSGNRSSCWRNLH